MPDLEFLKLDRHSVINRTFKWMPADTEKNYEKVKRRMEIPYGPNDITYKFNNYGFRCDDFDNWTNHPYRILFAGCSMTEGIGVPLEDLWARQLHQTIQSRLGQKIPFWTIASGGTGIDHMVRYFYHVYKLLKPQVVISILPNEVRRERWHEDRWSIWSVDLKGEQESSFFTDERIISYQTEKNLAMLNGLCEEIDCHFLYTTSTQLEPFKFGNLTRLDLMVEQIDYARDGIHSGPKTNKLIAEKSLPLLLPILGQKFNFNFPN